MKECSSSTDEGLARARKERWMHDHSRSSIFFISFISISHPKPSRLWLTIIKYTDASTWIMMRQYSSTRREILSSRVAEKCGIVEVSLHAMFVESHVSFRSFRLPTSVNFLTLSFSSIWISPWQVKRAHNTGKKKWVLQNDKHSTSLPEEPCHLPTCIFLAPRFFGLGASIRLKFHFPSEGHCHPALRNTPPPMLCRLALSHSVRLTPH